MRGTVLKGSLWSKGSPEPWYTPQVTWTTIFKRSLPAYIGVELGVYLILYYVLNITYRTAMDEYQKKIFEAVVLHINKDVNSLSREITFLLGFYVSLVVKRWWDQCRNLPWPGEQALLSTGLTLYETEEGRIISEEVARYQLLSYVLCMRKISKVIRNKFPYSSDLLEAGLINTKELKVLEGFGSLDTIWWLPLQWSMHRIKVAKIKKIIPSDQKELLRAVTNFKDKLDAVESYQHVPIPAVYKQVVNLGVYVYFVCALVGNQVAGALKNPFGDDVDDFEIGPLLSRHIWASGLHLEVGFAGLPQEDEENHNQGDIQIITVC